MSHLVIPCISRRGWFNREILIVTETAEPKPDVARSLIQTLRVHVQMGDSEFSSVHWDSPPPSSLPDTSEPNHIHNSNLIATSPPTTSVPPDMDPLQAPPSNEHTLICVIFLWLRLKANCSMYRLHRKKQMGQKMRMCRILSRLKYASSLTRRLLM